jgi:hypothetical protein
MEGHSVRAYADTSVFGGVVDDEFREASLRFLDGARTGRIALVVSVLVQDEIEGSPEPVQAAFEEMLGFAQFVDVDRQAYALQAAYLEHAVVTERWATDALHVAAASVGRCSMIVSWNFRHIVSFRRIPLYNAVNALMGYPALAIHSPLEVVLDEEDL